MHFLFVVGGDIFSRLETSMAERSLSKSGSSLWQLITAMVFHFVSFHVRSLYRSVRKGGYAGLSGTIGPSSASADRARARHEPTH
jgi:hypothetical protein